MQLNFEQINEAFAQIESLCFQLMSDFDEYQTNSEMLRAICQVFKAITWQEDAPSMIESLYQDNELCENFARRFSLSEFKQHPAKRKDIYIFMIKFINDLVAELPHREMSTFNQMIIDLEPKWSVVCKIAETT